MRGEADDDVLSENVCGDDLQVGDDGEGKVGGSAGAAHVRGLDSTAQNGLGDGIGNLVSVVVETKVTEHHNG